MPSVFRRASLALVAVAFAACSSTGQAGIAIAAGTTVIPHRPDERRPAPELAGESLMGGPAIEPSIVEGKVAVVHFWGSWCGPCRVEQPFLEATAQRFEGKDVQFLGINTRRDQRTAAQAFWREFDVSYPSIYDPASRLAHRFAVRFMPVTFVLDRQGRIAATIVGAVPEGEQLPSIIEVELGQT